MKDQITGQIVFLSIMNILRKGIDRVNGMASKSGGVQNDED
jgi:hypothetical protein